MGHCLAPGSSGRDLEKRNGAFHHASIRGGEALEGNIGKVCCCALPVFIHTQRGDGHCSCSAQFSTNITCWLPLPEERGGQKGADAIAPGRPAEVYLLTRLFEEFCNSANKTALASLLTY